MDMLRRIKNRKLAADVLSDMCRQISVMTGAGITMAKAMEILKNTTENKRIARIYEEVKAIVEHPERALQMQKALQQEVIVDSAERVCGIMEELLKRG